MDDAQKKLIFTNKNGMNVKEEPHKILDNEEYKTRKEESMHLYEGEDKQEKLYNNSIDNGNKNNDLSYQKYLELGNLNKYIGDYISNHGANYNGDVSLFDITYMIEKSPNANCGISNTLILDNTGYYYNYDEENSKINGESAKIVLNVLGSLITLNALYSHKSFSFSLSSPISSDPIDLNPDDMNVCFNTQYGFKLSEVISNLGFITQIPLDIFGGNTNGAQITLAQKVFILENKNQLIFNFYFKNNGLEDGRKVLFKDILPEGVTLNLNGVYINSCLYSGENVNIDGQKLLINIPNIPKMGSLTLTLICSFCKDYTRGQVNIGVVSYVSKYIVETPQTNLITINQSMSNSKSIEDVVQRCRKYNENTIVY